MNLAGNAAEAMPAGGVIRVMTRNRYLDTDIDRYERIPEGEYVILRVSDEGIGIPAGELHRIFEPFFSKKTDGPQRLGAGHDRHLEHDQGPRRLCGCSES